MAENEYYRLDLVVNVSGDGTTKKKLKTLDKFIDRTKKRAKVLNKVRISPAVRMKDRVTGPLKKIRSNLHKVASRTWIVTLRAKDRAFATIKKVKSALFSIPSMLGIGIGAGGGLFGTKKMLDASSFEEQAKTSLRVLLKSKKVADDTFKKAKNFADVTPFMTQEVISSTSALVAGRFKTADIFEGNLLRDVGDLAAVNQDVGASIWDVARVFTRLKAGDFGEAFERLRDFKISRQDLQEAGLSFSKSGEFLGTAEEAIAGVRKVIQKNFGGMMEEQSKTWAGLWSTFKSQATNTLAAIGKYEVRKNTTVLDLFKNRVKQITRLIYDPETEKLTPLAERFVHSMGDAFDWLDKKVEESSRWIKRMLDDPEFQKLDFGEKIGKVLGVTTDAIIPKAANIGVRFGKEFIKAMATSTKEAVMESPLLAFLLGAYIGMKVPGRVGIILAISIAAAPWVKKILESIGEEIPGTTLYVDKQIQKHKETYEWYEKRRKEVGSDKPVIRGGEIKASPKSKTNYSSFMLQGLNLYRPSDKKVDVSQVTSQNSVTAVNMYLDGAVKAQVNVKNKEDIDEISDKVSNIVLMKLDNIIANKA